MGNKLRWVLPVVLAGSFIAAPSIFAQEQLAPAPVRNRRRLRAEESAQKASIKILFPLVLFVLPAMIAVIVGPAMVQVVKTLSHSG